MILFRILIMFFPSRLKIITLNLLGCNISYKAKIGFSLILTKKLQLHSGATIGHLNFIRCRKLYLKKDAYIQHLNIIKGPFTVFLKERAAIGNQNHIVRAPKNISVGFSLLRLEMLTKITSGHYIDLTKSIIFGKYSILAGRGSQMWTHGYYHYKTGEGRYRVDGKIFIGDNVYIGARTVISMGLRISNAVTIGSNSSVSKSLIEQGLYVSQGLRHLPFEPEKAKSKFIKVDRSTVCEDVFEKDV